MNFHALQYCQYLLAAVKNFTITNFADHQDEVSHDTLRRYMKDQKIKPRKLWKITRKDIIYSPNGSIIFDDTVLNKNYSHKIDGVKKQYSGNTKSLINGIGVVNCLYYNPEEDRFWLVDYRIFNFDKDGYTKIDHVIHMLKNAVTIKQIVFKYVLADTWYATERVFNAINKRGKIYYCPLKTNRIVKEINIKNEREIIDKTAYVRINQLVWSELDKKYGKLIQLKKMSTDNPVRVYKIPVSTDSESYVITNEIKNKDPLEVVEKIYKFRWKIEEYHREIKQISGIERCQCRLNRIQRNHIGCCIFLWHKLKEIAYKESSKKYKKTIYAIKNGLLSSYLRKELKNPSILLNQV